MGSIDVTPHVALSPLDQIAPRIYVRSVFIFNIDRKFSINKALCYIADRFHASLLRWPFLTGQIRPATYPVRPNELELHYDLDENLANPSQRPDLFTYQFCEGLGGFNYERLKARGMPPSAMDKDILSLSPSHPKPGESCPPITLKVTGVNNGGLILCFSTHHAIFDGGFIKAFLQFFAQGSEKIPGHTFVREHMSRPNMDHYARTNIRNSLFSEYDFSTDTDLVSGVNRLDLSSTTLARAQKTPLAVCVLFKIQNSTLRILHGRALTELRNKHGPDAFVSIVDTLSALIWVHTTRARLPHLDLADKTSFTTAADARARLSPAFSADSWGNVYSQTSASTSVRDLVQAWGGMDMDSTPAVVAAAWHIRNAVKQVNTPDYIPSRIALAASLADPTMESVAFRKALQPDHAGLGCSVWTHMGADVDFGIPGTKGKADYVRKTWSANDGSMNILQRRGITKGEAPWEVLLALRGDDMERICAPAELGRWVSSWCV
ncbi:trichothecene 3-o-acetyltransferase [Colletotrichum incanum]|uniref:Trichothecene 3-o-acetyltransferase n=1 Tax=Colletotrichum incanum TaxID=1573173 RepID=A0A162NTF9_COLIC|nr:trichothecene 3-o-acetyltransferase [Colletotrichum incanum]OHW96205.1 trichothecene 3-o-acetyltransferase [Colletotrichum incanum]